MPIFEYVCNGCAERFEALVFGNRGPACPNCKGKISPHNYRSSRFRQRALLLRKLPADAAPAETHVARAPVRCLTSISLLFVTLALGGASLARLSL